MFSNSTATAAATPTPDGRGSLAAGVSIRSQQALTIYMGSPCFMSAAAACRSADGKNLADTAAQPGTHIHPFNSSFNRTLTGPTPSMLSLCYLLAG
jgi:hypothetical protein